MSFELDLLRQENAKLVAENTELKHKNSKLKQIIEENADFKAKIMKLEQTVDKIEKQNQTISQVSTSSPSPVTSQLSTLSPIEDHSDIIDDDSAETLDFVETVYKEQQKTTTNTALPVENLDDSDEIELTKNQNIESDLI
ncbi:9182_t:CDS:2 [Paraglomus occultum]|uniref:9182_t:CDS:1 n=1 Tax=Paraglomus occultum TaxID=144539 RepID=A0A9N9DBT2_9GLOM|nr:9182_t:CDS:2 [Paraglomus occultum]